jgi:hypothetical protein|tara:strand:+ start:129 stop:977 length:849 start_codon:yes stop_codon:yes gene_type:complete
MTDYKDKLYEKIAEVVSYVCNNPAIYFSETDIHVLMMKALMEIGCLKRRYNTKCTIGRNYKGKASEYKYKTMLVHKEYGCNTGKRERSDIVIFDEQGVNSIDDPINLKNGKKYLTPEYVFEFGTEKSASAIKNYEKHLKGDLKKLSKIENKGFLIHIQRTNVKASTETERFKKNRKRIQDYVNSTVKIWGNERKKLKDKVEVLIFFVDIGGERRTVREKVRMFNPYPKHNPKSKKDDSCPPVNSKDIKEIIKKFLKENNESERDIEEIRVKCREERKRSKKK